MNRFAYRSTLQHSPLVEYVYPLQIILNMYFGKKFPIDLVVFCPLSNFPEIPTTMQRISPGNAPLCLFMPCPYKGRNICRTHYGFPKAGDTVIRVSKSICYVALIIVIVVQSLSEHVLYPRNETDRKAEALDLLTKQCSEWNTFNATI